MYLLVNQVPVDQGVCYWFLLHWKNNNDKKNYVNKLNYKNICITKNNIYIKVMKSEINE